MRNREIHPYLDITVGAYGLPHGSHKWVIGGTLGLLVVIGLPFPEVRFYYVPVWLICSGGYLLGSALFFNWARSRRTPRWLEHRLKWWWIGRDTFRGYRPCDACVDWLKEDETHEP